MTARPRLHSMTDDAGAAPRAVPTAPGGGLRDRRQDRLVFLDARPGTPDLASFPRSQWTSAVHTASREATNAEQGRGGADRAACPRQGPDQNCDGRHGWRGACTLTDMSS